MSDVEVRVPRENVNDETVTIVEWQIQSGQQVDESQVLAVIETSKTVLEIVAPKAGFVHFSTNAGEEIAVGGVLCVISESAQAPQSLSTGEMPRTVRKTSSVQSDGQGSNKKSPGGSAIAEIQPPSRDFTSTRFSEAANRLLKERNIDASVFAGRGLVRERDVLEYLGDEPASPSPKKPEHQSPSITSGKSRGAGEAAPLVDNVAVRLEALSRQKSLEIRYLESGFYHTLPSAVTHACPTRGFRQLASQRAELFGNATAIIVFEVARLLKKFPIFNACHQNGQVAFYEEVNIGFAVDAGLGLKVPVIHRADEKTLPAIASEMQDLILAYLDNQLPVEALARGTFTITDLSGENVYSFQPLINQGQSAILGIGAEMYLGGPLGSFQLILAFDHRLSDGRTAGQFVGALSQRIMGHESAMRGRDDQECVDGMGASSASSAAACARCGRTPQEIEELRGYLIASVVPRGFLCSICLSGY